MRPLKWFCNASRMEAPVSTLVVKGMPDDLHEALNKRARRNHRSLNEEAVSIIEQAVREGDVRPAQRMPTTNGEPLTSQELEAALTDDRYGHLGTLADVEELMNELRADRGEPGA